MWRDYFSFNKRQRNGIIVLSSLIIAMVCWLAILDHTPPPRANTDFTQFKSQLAGIGSPSASGKADSNSAEAPVSNEILNKAPAGKININTCTVKDLAQFPGIGYYLALAIVNYRELHGPYKTVKDLLRNKAMDDTTFSKIEERLSTN